MKRFFDPDSSLNNQTDPQTPVPHSALALNPTMTTVVTNSTMPHPPLIVEVHQSHPPPHSLKNSARLYSTPKPPASLSLRTSLVSEPLVPTNPDTLTSPRAKTVTFTLSPTATVNSVSHMFKKATGIIKRKSTLAPNKSVTMENKKRTLEIVDSVYTPWLSELVKAWNTEDILRNPNSNGRRADEEGQ
ncbi:hypothetical protein K435DRAFT_869879 [Dendrothele bispora CBS 962.96]|uniref:Uncharacterized protein n=1 Tax=Dendrothele bispora (strain CBS 962.96) TaxID=1314807 RepID=A0A4S8L8F1_DENBC|nr:hypothetical protein K435DRAFT_869879 [Dendrothele bispora CBS 962.96]